MGQLITALDETGVNQLFKKAWNQSGDITSIPGGGPLEIGKTFGQNGATAKVKLKARLRPQDFNQADVPINLLGSTHSPHARYGGLKLELHVRSENRVDVGGFSASADFDLHLATVTLAGSAWAGVENQPDHRQAWLDLDATGTSVAIVVPDDLDDRIRAALESIDTNPVVPGKQKLPAALVNAAVAAVLHAFSQAAGSLSDMITQAVRAVTNNFRLRLGHKVPKQFDLPVPTGGTVQVLVTGLQIAISANDVKVTATFE